MRAYFVIDGEKLELEDTFFAQFTLENMCVYLEDKKYVVSRVKRKITRSGNNLDSELEIYLE